MAKAVFSCRRRVRFGPRALASFLRAVAEACSPQLERFREENFECGCEIYLVNAPQLSSSSAALEPGDM